MPPMKREAAQRDSLWGDTLSITQLARRWNLTPKAIRQLLGAQRLAFVQINGQFRIPREDAQRYAQENRLDAEL